MRLTINETLYQDAKKNITKKGEDFDKAFEGTLKKAGNIIAQEARSRSPKDSGEGKKTIRARKVTKRSGKSIAIGPDESHFYLLFPEYGTEFQDSQWFVHGALEGKENEVLNSIERDLKAVIS